MKCSGLMLGLVLALAGQFADAATDRDTPAAVTTVSAEEFAALKRDFADVLRRVNQLETENASLRQGQQQNEQAVVQIRGTQAETRAASWADRINWKGDFRFRYQNDDRDLPGVGDRGRERIRARPALVAKLPQDVEVGFGLASGSSDPVSSNQTLGDGGSSKQINLDLAYFDWSGAAEGLQLIGGKFKNGMVRAGDNGLLWDSDWRPEGFEVLYEHGMFFGNALGTWLESDGSDGKGSEFAWGLQGGVVTEVGPTKVRAGGSYYDIPSSGNVCYYDSEDCFGNSFVVNGAGDQVYVYDYELVEGFVEVDFEAFGLPSQLYGDYVTNLDPDNNENGYAMGLRLGDASKRGTWQVSYTYEDLEADAVLGLLTDSDFAGGGTDSKGSKFGAAYALTDATKLSLTYFLTERQDENGVENGGDSYDWDTLQVDLEFKYK